MRPTTIDMVVFYSFFFSSSLFLFAFLDYTNMYAQLRRPSTTKKSDRRRTNDDYHKVKTFNRCITEEIVDYKSLPSSNCDQDISIRREGNTLLGTCEFLFTRSVNSIFDWHARVRYARVLPYVQSVDRF